MATKGMLQQTLHHLSYYHLGQFPKTLLEFQKFVENYIEPPAMDYKHSMKFEVDIEFKDKQSFYDVEVYVEFSYTPEQKEIIHPCR